MAVFCSKLRLQTCSATLTTIRQPGSLMSPEPYMMSHEGEQERVPIRRASLAGSPEAENKAKATDLKKAVSSGTCQVAKSQRMWCQVCTLNKAACQLKCELFADAKTSCNTVLKERVSHWPRYAPRLPRNTHDFLVTGRLG